MHITTVEDLSFLTPDCVNKLREFGCALFDTNPINEETVLNRIGDAELIIIKRVKIDDELLMRLPKLRYIITLTIGTKHVATEHAKRRGITVLNCPTYNANAVAEHTFALLFAVCRNITMSNLLLKGNKWKSSPDAYTGYEVAGKLLVVVGKGKIGSLVMHKARAFGLQIAIIDSKTSYEERMTLFKKADFISIHAPLNEKTRGIIDKNVFSIVKSNCILVNTSNNELIEEKALLEALKKYQIAGCGLDIFENNPLTGDLSPILKKVLSLPQVIATPHVAFNTYEANNRLGNELITNIESILNNKPQNVVV